MCFKQHFHLFFSAVVVFAFVSCKKRTSSPPLVNTINTYQVNSYSANIICLVSADPMSYVVRGVAYAKHPNVDVSDMKVIDPNMAMGESGAMSFMALLSSLDFSTTYYARAFASNTLGVFYGEEISFTTQKDTTLQIGSMSDIDGNTYKTIVIENKEWMAENLKVSHYRNGAPIPVVTNNTDWTGLTSGASCWYNNDSAAMNRLYGKLYNLSAVSDSQKICPQGWHVPNGGDWTTLYTTFGGTFIAGGSLKTTGTAHWQSPNSGATNQSGFSGMPSGLRQDDGTFISLGKSTSWWSIDNGGNLNGGITLAYYDTDAFPAAGGSSKGGFPLRCIKD